MEHKDDRNTDEDFLNRPLKKAKYPESSALDDSLASPMVSEYSKSVGSESSDPLSPFSELMKEETISTEDEQTVPADDDKQPDNTLPLPPSSTMSHDVSGLMNEETTSIDDDKQRHNSP